MIRRRREDKNGQAKKECEALCASKVIAIATDIADPKSVKALFEKAKEALDKPITHVFINAGVFPTILCQQCCR